MTLKKKMMGIALSLMVAVTFMPITGQNALAAESDSPEVTEPEPAFNPSGVMSSLRLAGSNYKSVTIGWSAYEKALGYQVYSATKKKGKYKLICTTSGLVCYDKYNKKLGKSRYYKVRAYGTVNGRTVYTGFSGVFAAKPNLSAPVAWTSGGSSKITVAWSKVSGASKYQVYRATSKYGKYKKLTTTKKRSYTGKSVTKNKRYYYKVRAKRGSKSGYFCGPVEGITILSAPSYIGVGNNADGGINVSWSGVGNAAGYQVFRSTNYSSDFRCVGTVNAASFTDTDDSLADGTTYFYKVRAYAGINGRAQYGYMSSGSYREAAVAQAAAWIGAKESNGSHKGIVKIYNGSTNKGKIGYKTAWCAAFVSAVAIKTGNTSIIPVDCYCPRMLNKYKSWKRTANRSYAANGGDIIFFDWNNNNVPDHVGMVYYRKSKQITTIEGNYSDAVKCRTFTPGWSDVLAYGLPAYNERGKITYSAPQGTSASVDMLVEDPVEETDVQEIVETVETGGEAQNPPESDREIVETLVEVIQEKNPAEESPADESTFNAFLMYKACEDMGIEACVVTEINSGGDENSYNEVIIDGERYLIDPTDEESKPVKYFPEGMN